MTSPTGQNPPSTPTSMSVEMEEITEFLVEHEPFTRLPFEDVQELARTMTATYVRRGDAIIKEGEVNDVLYVIRSGAVDIISGEVLLDRRDAGRSFGYSTIMGDSQSVYRIDAVEDSLLLMLPRDVFVDFAQKYPDFKRYYSSLTLRIAQAAAQLDDDSFSATLRSRIVDAIRPKQTALIVGPKTSIRDVALAMVEKNTTAALIARPVTDGMSAQYSASNLLGLITDKDLRTRVVARGVDTQNAVEEVMTPRPVALGLDATVMEALVAMSEHGISHLPVMPLEDGAQAHPTILTTNNLLELLRNDPVYLIADIARHKDRKELRGTFDRAAEIVGRFIERGAKAADASRMMTIAADAIARRLIELAEQAYGPAPIPYAFVTVGSQGRYEMGLASDQDNALILADSFVSGEHGEYFQKVSSFVCEGLAEAGQVLCPGGMMASNSEWRMTVAQWQHSFSTWVAAPQPDSVLQAQVFFDMRTVSGDNALTEAVHTHALNAARPAKRFHAHLAALAARREPPLGFFRGFVVDRSGQYAKTLDIKKGGSAGVVQMARLYAVAAGVAQLDTRTRIKRAAGSSVSKQGAENLIDAFDYLTTITMRHQAAQLRQGLKPDNHLNPQALSKMERENLRDAFHIVGSMYKALTTRYPVRST